MKPITVKQLYQLCKNEITKGHGDYKIMISQDDEGNGYHYLWYSFQTVKEFEQPMEYGKMTYQADFDWNINEISTKDDTIILG